MAVNVRITTGSGYYYGGNMPVTDANSLFIKISDIFDMVVYMLIGLAVVFIVWNGFQFIRSSESEEGRKKYGTALMWGVIGLFVILSLWGLVYILGNTFGTGNAENSAQSSVDYQSIMLQGK